MTGRRRAAAVHAEGRSDAGRKISLLAGRELWDMAGGLERAGSRDNNGPTYRLAMICLWQWDRRGAEGAGSAKGEGALPGYAACP